MEQVFFYDPNVVILNGQENMPILIFSADRNRAACLSILDPIFHQIREQLGQQALVSG